MRRCKWCGRTIKRVGWWWVHDDWKNVVPGVPSTLHIAEPMERLP